ncbi:MAG: hypothetical protein CVV18_01030 [Gammaproteobacteria bacterium HGW-Gammaproteobacteria-8]|nr:MAG: hypothetical protein CVV18_01030 [Gammaproteobacteria bacterium HGW-Gammaproteobacteria-8]
MDDSARRTARVLGFSGLIPFAVLVAVAIIGAPAIVERVLLGYAVAILAFLCGGLWAGVIVRDDVDSASLIVSNALLLAALPALVLPLVWSAPLLALLFAVHAVYEGRRLGAGFPRWYRHLRQLLSIGAVVLLVLTAVVGLRGA